MEVERLVGRLIRVVMGDGYEFGSSVDRLVLRGRFG